MLKRNNNKLTILLVLVVLSVWGAIGLNVVNYFNSANDNSRSTIVSDQNTFKDNMIKIKQDESDSISFVELEKSPFEFEKIAAEKPKLAQPKVAVQTITPQRPKLNYKISGVVVSDNRKILLFEDLTNKQTVFLSEGEAYKNIVIKEIQVEKVILMENDFEQVIILKR